MTSRVHCRSDAEFRELWAMRRLEARAEAELEVLTERLAECGRRQAETRRRLVPAHA